MTAQFAIVALRRAGRPFLGLLCSLGFRLAVSATGGARLRPQAPKMQVSEAILFRAPCIRSDQQIARGAFPFRRSCSRLTTRGPPSVRNGRPASGRGALPGAPLLTGLPPRFFRHWRRSAPPPCEVSLVWLGGLCFGLGTRSPKRLPCVRGADRLSYEVQHRKNKKTICKPKCKM